MIDKMKTVLLTVLVSLSLVQSYLLVFSGPSYDPVNQTEYVQTDTVGTQEKVEDLLFPEQMILHLGENRHTVLYPNDTFYSLIFQSIKQDGFDTFQRSNLTADNLDNAEHRALPGVELRFRSGVPLSILQSVIPIRGELPYEPSPIKRIWFFTGAGSEEVKIYFFTDNPLITYEATRTDFTVQDIERFVGLGALLPLYHSEDGDIYLPEQPIGVVGLKMPYNRFTAEQMQVSLFVDPSNTRVFRGRDGSEIYTDGKRGLQLMNDMQWMSYSDPIPVVEIRNDVKENLNAAVQFINQHGGWNGRYLASRIPPVIEMDRQTILFQQYVDHMPIVSEQDEGLGIIRIVLQKGVVSNYERSMIFLDSTQIERQELTLIGGQELTDKLAAYDKRLLVDAVLPAYRPIIGEAEVELVPQWAVRLKDGTMALLE